MIPVSRVPSVSPAPLLHTIGGLFFALHGRSLYLVTRPTVLDDRVANWPITLIEKRLPRKIEFRSCSSPGNGTGRGRHEYRLVLIATQFGLQLLILAGHASNVCPQSWTRDLRCLPMHHRPVLARSSTRVCPATILRHYSQNRFVVRRILSKFHFHNFVVTMDFCLGSLLF